MKNATIFLLLGVIMAACNPGNDDVNDIIVFDYKTNYPTSDLTLTDIADVEYIPIGKSDDFLMSGMVNAKAGATKKNV